MNCPICGEVLNFGESNDEDVAHATCRQCDVSTYGVDVAQAKVRFLTLYSHPRCGTCPLWVDIQEDHLGTCYKSSRALLPRAPNDREYLQPVPTYATDYCEQHPAYATWAPAYHRHLVRQSMKKEGAKCK